METTAEILKIIENLNFKGYNFLKENKETYLNNFFIWKKKNKSEYIRITLTNGGLNKDYFLFWNLENSFKPFAYKHNHREGGNIQSERFKINEKEKYLSEFLKIVEIAKAEKRKKRELKINKCSA